MDSNFLSTFSLSEQEAKAYLALLELGSTTIKPIADKAGLKRTSIYNFIDRLISLGLVSSTVIRGRKHFAANSPERLLDLQKERLASLESSLPALLALFNSSPGKPRISYFEGPSQVKNILREEGRCRKETLYIWPGRESLEAIGGASVMNEIDRRRIKKGVWVRTVRFRQKDARYGLSSHGPKYLRELRWAPPEIKLKMGLGIYDNGKVGFFSSRNESFGVLIESSELQELMTSLFRLLWAASSPATKGEG